MSDSKNNNVLSFVDLVSKSRMRDNYFEVDGIGKIKTIEYPGSMNAKRLEEAKKIDNEDLEGNQKHAAWWACFAMLGKEPAKKDITQLRKSVSPEAIADIYWAALNYHGETQAGKEAIEKNS